MINRYIRLKTVKKTAAPNEIPKIAIRENLTAVRSKKKKKIQSCLWVRLILAGVVDVFKNTGKIPKIEP